MAASEAPEVEGTLLERLLSRRQALANEVEPLIDAREEKRDEWATRSASEEFEQLEDEPRKEERDGYAAEEESFSEEIAPKLAELRALDARIDEQKVRERSRELAEQASRGEGRVSVTSEPSTYRVDNQRDRSYWLDLAAMEIPEVRQKASGLIDGYRDRLEHHAKEIEDQLSKRHSERERRAQAAIEQAERETRARVGGSFRGFDITPFETRAPTRVPGQGGYFVPPLWLVDQYIPALRPGRVAAGLCRQMPLPQGTDSINVPKLNTPTLTGVQTADAGPVTSRDFTDTFVQANVKTIAGQEDVPIQLIEQSPGQILDEVLTTDLFADYNKQVDVQVLTGNGTGAPLSGGQIVGLYPASNWSATSVVWNQTSPTGQAYFQALGAGASKTAYSRFSLQDFTYLGHPRRWFWAATALDGQNRPLIEASDFSAFNLIAEEQNPTPFEGLAGRVPFGPNYYIDANIPTTDSAHSTGGTNDADVTLGAIWDDVWLFEGELRTRVLQEVLSGTLQIRYQLYNYVALLARYGQSLVLITGTSMFPPTADSGNISF